MHSTLCRWAAETGGGGGTLPSKSWRRDRPRPKGVLTSIFLRRSDTWSTRHGWQYRISNPWIRTRDSSLQHSLTTRPAAAHIQSL